MSNLPSESRAQKKRVTYGLGISQINYFILRIGVVQNLIKLPYDLCKHCGGRVLEVDEGRQEYQWNGTQYVLNTVPTKKCYRIHPQTLELLSPTEAREMADDDDDSDEEASLEVERVSKARMTLYHPQTGEFVQYVELTNAELVRTDCSRRVPEYQNPYENLTVFPSTLPTDEMAEATLFQMYQTNEWVDARWVRQNVSRISKDSDALERRAKKKARMAKKVNNANMEKRNTEGATNGTNPSGAENGNPGPEISKVSSE